jgi:hypothetical protein
MVGSIPQRRLENKGDFSGSATVMPTSATIDRMRLLCFSLAGLIAEIGTSTSLISGRAGIRPLLLLATGLLAASCALTGPTPAVDPASLLTALYTADG